MLYLIPRLAGSIVACSAELIPPLSGPHLRGPHSHILSELLELGVLLSQLLHRVPSAAVDAISI
jgi:hypothetical protein